MIVCLLIKERNKRMAKTLHCNDLGFDCGFVAKADNEQDLLGQVADHAASAHGVSEITPELLEQVKGAIKEE